ncbi:MAG: acetate/propionate family kinase, partial [Candidatus Eremiobacteraeota bacterium]|nr:acetate/propionate family kinase [Candidatus Eremiobacteraeota bacterium]
MSRLDDPPPLAPARQTAAGEDELTAALGEDVDVVTHRFVRLPDGSPPVLRLDDGAASNIGGVSGEAPLHDTRALEALATVRRLRPDLPQLAVSDGAFQRTMPAAATTYALPRELTRYGLRRWGYHGFSHEYAAHRATALAGFDVSETRV